MKIKANYWPSTPHLRELKIYVHDKLELSSFCNLEEISRIIDALSQAKKEIQDRARYKEINND